MSNDASAGRCYITTPIYYVNAEPHIGHTYTTVLVDTLARYHRLLGEKTRWLTGTDEHGDKIAEVAVARDLTPQQVDDEISGAFREAWTSLGFSHDAKFDSLKYVLDQANAVVHPSDGGGRAWIESVEDQAGAPLAPRAGGLARIHLIYEAGPLGIANGGALYFQVSSYWEWDSPQNIASDAPGYTEVMTDAVGV